MTRQWQTQLVAGVDEPIYVPAAEERSLHCIVFAHGYFNSALHELAHWCVAGPERRLLDDYGYWYCPDGRNAQQQAAFEQVEVKPQALEWWFAQACGRRFRTSRDNLGGEDSDSRPFREAVQRQALGYLHDGLPDRAHQVVQQLSHGFGQRWPTADDFAALPA
ncbi:hypothetical protein BGP77_07405 [Saccharospirillum sp. MSK14-1]|nr:hypothetical protein BGP77_07405 [Saccharospirillum sp. MSK14-1]